MSPSFTIFHEEQRTFSSIGIAFSEQSQAYIHIFCY
ncbi:hypothetical protein [Paenibacillus tundrae]